VNESAKRVEYLRCSLGLERKLSVSFKSLLYVKHVGGRPSVLAHSSKTPGRSLRWPSLGSECLNVAWDGSSKRNTLNTRSTSSSLERSLDATRPTNRRELPHLLRSTREFPSAGPISRSICLSLGRYTDFLPTCSTQYSTPLVTISRICFS